MPFEVYVFCCATSMSPPSACCCCCCCSGEPVLCATFCWSFCNCTILKSVVSTRTRRCCHDWKVSAFTHNSKGLHVSPLSASCEAKLAFEESSQAMPNPELRTRTGEASVRAPPCVRCPASAGNAARPAGPPVGEPQVTSPAKRKSAQRASKHTINAPRACVPACQSVGGSGGSKRMLALSLFAIAECSASHHANSSQVAGVRRCQRGCGGSRRPNCVLLLPYDRKWPDRPPLLLQSTPARLFGETGPSALDVDRRRHHNFVLFYFAWSAAIRKCETHPGPHRSLVINRATEYSNTNPAAAWSEFAA